MSWLFSQALVAEYSEGTSLAGEQFAQLNVMPTPHKFWRNDKTMEFSNLSRFGLTLRLLTESHGETLLMAFLAGFRAKTSALQERVLVSRVHDQECGSNSNASFARWIHGKSMWKTAQHSLFEDLEQSLETWPRWGLMRNGECFHVQMRAEFIYASASGLSLPTPRSCSAMAAKITPNTALAKHPNLETVLARLMLPTIGANEGKGASKSRFSGSPDFRGAKMCEGLRTCETDPIYLNPSFAELTMMWPLGWTDLKPLAMDRFLEWQQQHSLCLLSEQDSGERNDMPTLRQTIHIQHELPDLPGEAHQPDTEAGRQEVAEKATGCRGRGCDACSDCRSGEAEESADLREAW